MQNKQSVLIEAQIQDTQAHLTEMQARVVAIDEQLKALTTADDFDPNSKDVRRLMDEQSRLFQELNVTGFRIDSLKQKYIDAIREEMKARLAEVVQLITTTVGSASKTASQWPQGIEKLMGLLKECQTHNQHYAELTSEARYLAAVLNADCPSFLPLSMPKEEDVTLLKQLGDNKTYSVTLTEGKAF